uniref:Uncharacterized protein n=1 Tax=Sphaerodactylus townsendi TaxID=933632 RepID=A0ACB8GBV2_9SAUR
MSQLSQQPTVTTTVGQPLSGHLTQQMAWGNGAQPLVQQPVPAPPPVQAPAFPLIRAHLKLSVHFDSTPKKLPFFRIQVDAHMHDHHHQHYHNDMERVRDVRAVSEQDTSERQLCAQQAGLEFNRTVYANSWYCRST